MTPSSTSPVRVHGARNPLATWATMAVLIAVLMAVLMAAGLATAAPAALQSQRLPEHAFGPLGQRAETALRQAQPELPLRALFHRAQSFVVQPGAWGGPPWQLVSMEWAPESGGNSHCVLALFSAAREAPVLIDPLEDRATGDRMPWSCDGEPALRFVDAPGCARVLALHPMRPPSGERFLLPTVVGCVQGSSTPALDRAATMRLREAAVRGARIDSLAAMQRVLDSLPAEAGRHP